MKIESVCKYYDIILEDKKDIMVDYTLNVSVNDSKFKAKGNGTFKISPNDAKSILATEDVINLIINKEAENVKNINRDGISSKELLSQMLFAFLNPAESAQYLSTKDSIFFSFNYGLSENDSIGITATKNIGSPAFSIIMRLNRETLTNQFNKAAIDSKITSYSSPANSL